MLKIIASGLAALGTAAHGQAITSYQSGIPSPIAGDSDKIVCQKEETIGTRLGAKKVCLTVAEWKERERIHRQQVDRMQAGACVPQAGCVKGQYGDGP